jgi:hypothetical protein
LTSPLPDGAHSLNVSASNGSESVTATDPYVFSTTQIMVTGVYSDGTLVTQGGAANGTVTITGWIADPSLASKGMKLYVSGGNVGTGTVLSSDVTVTGNTFTAVVSQESTVNSLYSIAMADGTYHIDARAVGDSTNILTVSDSRLGWTFSDTWANSAVQTVSAVQGDHSAAAGDASALSSSQQAVSHASVGAHDAFTGVTGGAIVDLNADPASCFKDASAHIQGATGGVNTLHLVGDHQVLDMTSLSGQTSAAKVSGIQTVDLGGHSNTLNLSLVDVLNLGEPNLFQNDGNRQMMVSGSNGDTVSLSNTHLAGVTDGDWQQHGTAQVGGIAYNVYENASAHAELLVQQGVQVALHH